MNFLKYMMNKDMRFDPLAFFGLLKKKKGSYGENGAHGSLEL